MVSREHARQRRSPLSFIALALLCEHPMHAYGLHKLMRQRGQDELVNIERRNSLQQALERLHRDGYIEVVPDAAPASRRVVYRATAEGWDLLLGWIRDTIARPHPEYASLPAAVSLIAFLPAEEATTVLDRRRTLLGQLIEEKEAARKSGSHLPEVLLLEVDLNLTLWRAELSWLDDVARRIASEALTWDTTALLEGSAAAEFLDT